MSMIVWLCWPHDRLWPIQFVPRLLPLTTRIGSSSWNIFQQYAFSFFGGRSYAVIHSSFFSVWTLVLFYWNKQTAFCTKTKLQRKKRKVQVLNWLRYSLGKRYLWEWDTILLLISLVQALWDFCYKERWWNTSQLLFEMLCMYEIRYSLI